MRNLLSKVDWFFAIGLIGYPAWVWHQAGWRIRWTTADFGLLFMAIIGALYIFLKKISD